VPCCAAGLPVGGYRTRLDPAIDSDVDCLRGPVAGGGGTSRRTRGRNLQAERGAARFVPAPASFAGDFTYDAAVGANSAGLPSGASSPCSRQLGLVNRQRDIGVRQRRFTRACYGNIHVSHGVKGRCAPTKTVNRPPHDPTSLVFSSTRSVLHPGARQLLAPPGAQIIGPGTSVPEFLPDQEQSTSPDPRFVVCRACIASNLGSTPGHSSRRLTTADLEVAKLFASPLAYGRCSRLSILLTSYQVFEPTVYYFGGLSDLCHGVLLILRVAHHTRLRNSRAGAAADGVSTTGTELRARERVVRDRMAPSSVG